MCSDLQRSWARQLWRKMADGRVHLEEKPRKAHASDCDNVIPGAILGANPTTGAPRWW